MMIHKPHKLLSILCVFCCCCKLDRRFFYTFIVSARLGIKRTDSWMRCNNLAKLKAQLHILLIQRCFSFKVFLCFSAMQTNSVETIREERVEDERKQQKKVIGLIIIRLMQLHCEKNENYNILFSLSDSMIVVACSESLSCTKWCEEHH